MGISALKLWSGGTLLGPPFEPDKGRNEGSPCQIGHSTLEIAATARATLEIAATARATLEIAAAARATPETAATARATQEPATATQEPPERRKRTSPAAPDSCRARSPGPRLRGDARVRQPLHRPGHGVRRVHDVRHGRALRHRRDVDGVLAD